MSFQDACESSLLKAREGLKGWKNKMETAEGDDDLTKIKKSMTLLIIWIQTSDSFTRVAS